MAVLVDPARWPAHGTLWSHLVSDSSLGELHAFAHRAGVPARGFDQDHYDVPATRVDDLAALGAERVGGHELITRLRASGLRRPPRLRAAERARLLLRWREAAGPRQETLAAAGVDLLARWSQRGRLHHDARHLSEVLDAIDLLADAEAAPAADLRVARLGAWFHDAVHASGLGRDEPHPDPAGSDEAASADLALRLLPDDPDAGRVAGVVLMTATHDPAADDDAALLLSDADLAVLGASPQRYADYAAAIRQEYAHVPDAVFRPGRAAILEALLDGELYGTATARHRWDAAAKANLEAEVAALRA
ncbi:MAG: DUF4031 domain-containing protein [Salana multivorans]|uniref:DUF4031 domain-containing protein n=1 Tax=Salana multivorans TaxID=120377 RepID=UPI0009601CD7|nr:DUF4031 domain-containing protein [Salana multivorans]MBN8881994.1 DUF4031 domain-containing protein [Salana multivorans]OJX93914.1 MAG: hypothetical protein BGO96_00145 [Micrococcales bacterium 73-15]